MKFKEQNEKYWDKGSQVYTELILDELNNFKKEAWKNLIKKNIGDSKVKKVLDVGTGPGFFAIIMSEMGYDVTAIDSSEMMLEKAIANAKLAGVSVKFEKSDVNNMNFSKESFDLIISRNVTWTLKSPTETYKLWYDLLKKDGKVLVFDANWNTRLIDKEVQIQYEKDQKIAKDMGYYIDIGDELEQNGDELSLKLPLTYKSRPKWDKSVLLDIGFKDLSVEENIEEGIHTKAEKIANGTTPMFSICALK